jgi:ClpP class serine protease
MTDLDLALRRPGQILLLERTHALGLLDRMLTTQRPGRGLFGNALSALGLKPTAGHDIPERPKVLGLPSLPWAENAEQGEGYLIVDGIAVMDVAGVMTPHGYYDWWEDRWVGGYAQIGASHDAAEEDDRVRAIFARVNFPGGLVDGCFDLCDDMAARSKPFHVHARMACSAAYALASTADRIDAPREGDVGSIGVLITHYDISDMLAEWGVKVEAIQSGPRKTDAAEWKPLSDDARAHLKAVVDQIAKRFVATVEAGRPMTAEQIRATEARWYLAEHDDPEMSGMALGLVDGIATERAAFAALHQSLETSGGPAARAASTTEKEAEMSLEEQIAALRAKAARGDAAAKRKLKSLGVSLKATTNDDDPDAETEEDDPESETEEDDPEAETDKEEEGEGTDDDPEAETEDEEAEDDDEEPAAKATGSKAGFALMGCKEAKGREKLAANLARKVGAKKLNYGEAKQMLAAAPKGSRLGQAMAGRDRNPGASHGSGKASAKGLASAVDRYNAKRK